MSVIDEYLKNLASEFSAISSDDECLLVTPTCRPDGEAVEIIVKETKDGQIRLTDDFSTLDYLFVNGLNPEHNEKLYEDAVRIAKNRGVKLEKSEIFIESSPGSEGDALNKLLSAIEAITYLLYRRTHREVKSFTDEVELFLAEHEITFNSSYILQGKTVEHVAPIYVNSSKNLVISPLSASDVATARHRVNELAFIVLDVKPVQPRIRFTALLDDRKPSWEQVWSNESVSRILSTLMDETLRWENHQRLLNLARTE